MSGVLSNTGTAAKSGVKRSRLLMPLVFAAAMGGNLSLIGAPILIVGILFYATIGFYLLPNHDPKGKGVFDEQKDFSAVPQWKKKLSLVILVATLLGMIFEKQIHISLSITGCVGAVLLIFTGVISEDDALKSIDLKTIFLFGDTLSLASASIMGDISHNIVYNTLAVSRSALTKM